MEIKTDNWFPSTVWSSEFLDINNQKIVDFAYQLKNQDPLGANNTNYFGWQSNFLDSRTADLEIKKLVGNINQMVESIRIGCNLPPLDMYNIWININKKGSYNTVHNHRNSIISGCYYVKVPENSGNIEFYRNDEADYYLPDNLTKFNHFNSTKVIYPSRENQILLFPSWLKHGVQGSRAEEDRISIAFNYGLR